MLREPLLEELGGGVLGAELCEINDDTELDEDAPNSVSSGSTGAELERLSGATP